MKTTIFVCLAMFAAAPALADSTYDWQTGNMYNYNTDTFGNTRVQGYNLNNGSNWNTNIQRNGNMNGFDSGGNYWNYNKNTGTYWNSDGTFCTGKGAYRTCN